METLKIFPLSAFEDNYIWCLRRDGVVAVVDPGDATPVLNHLAGSGDRLGAILITHHHHDHIGGIAELTARHPVPVFAPVAEAIAGTTRPVSGGDRVALPELGIEYDVLDVAGHTRGHVAYYASAGPSQGGISSPVGGSEPNLRAWGANTTSAGPSQGGVSSPVGGSEPNLRVWGANTAGRGTLFCGDTLFGCGCGRLFEGTPAQLHTALSRIAVLPRLTLAYCAHEYTASGIRFARAVEPGNTNVEIRGAEVERLRAQGQATVPFTIEDELATNPFLRCTEPGVIASVRARLGREPTSELEVFTVLREWRDRF
jgi:hydroxyacylglutathione hydrolase